MMKKKYYVINRKFAKPLRDALPMCSHGAVGTGDVWVVPLLRHRNQIKCHVTSKPSVLVQQFRETNMALVTVQND